MKKIVLKKIYYFTYTTAIFLFLILSAITLILFNEKFNARANESQEILQDRFDFSDNSVLVTMDKDVGGVNKSHDKSYFGNIAIIDVTDLTYRENVKNINLNNFRQILRLDLQYNDKNYVLQAVEKISKIKGVEAVTPNYFGEFCATASDPEYSKQWGLCGDNGINIHSAWNLTSGNEDVRVGVIDSGIARHSDLNDNIINGLSFVENDNSTEDIHGHGTHVAGIIGAKGDNSIGISGVCKNVKIVPLKVSNKKSWSIDNVVSAINYASDLWGTYFQIDILNFSGWNFPNNINFYNAIRNYQGLFVAIAGNGSSDIDRYPNYPASFDCDNMITVGALNQDGAKRETSNYGKNTVDIFAPGGNILSTYPQGLCTGQIRIINGAQYLACECKWSPTEAKWVPNGTTHYENGYHYMSGTSMAAPHVTGVAALMFSIKPDLNGAQLKQAILNGADDITISTSAGKQDVKKLNAYKALSLLANKDENGYYFEEFDYQNFSMYHNIDLNTICCRPDGSYEVMDNEQGILGGFNGMSVSLCDMTGKKINYSEWTFFECELVIYTQGVVNSGCYVYDDDGNYLDECTFSMEEGALHVPLNELFNRNLSSFLLIPGYEEESGGWSGTYTVGFSPSDVYLNLFARKYV